MSIRAVLRYFVPLLACLAATAEGQKLIVLPGASSSTATASAFTANPLGSAGTINAAPGAFLAFANPAGSRFFIVTTSGVVVTDSSGAQVQTPLTAPSLAIPNVTSAALSPDGSILVVVSGNSSSGEASIFDVSGDTASPQATVTVGNNPLDVAIGLDSATAYVINPAGVTPIDLSANTAGTPVTLAGLAPSGVAKPGVSVGPNGLVYVNASGAVYELHPATLATLNTIIVSGFPGKPSFSPDAKAAAVANQPAGAPYASVLNLVNHMVSGDLSHSGLGNYQVGQVFYAAPYVYLTSVSSHYLDQFLISPPGAGFEGILGPSFPTGTVGFSVNSAAVSNEPAGPHYLFAAGPNGVTRLDVSPAATASVTVPLSTTPGPAFYVSPENTDTPASATQFNPAQALSPGAISVPLIVQVRDAAGLPVAGVTVKWTPQSGVTLQSSMTTTNAQGLAVATATAPKTVGSYTVAAAISGVAGSPTFTLNVSTSASGGGGGVGASGLSMVSGNGQVAASGYAATQPFVVEATDTSGNPMPGATVTFTADKTGGTLSGNSCTPENAAAVKCIADSSGIASAIFNAPGIPASYSNVLLSTVTVSSSAGGSIPFVITTVPLTGLGTLYPIITALAPASGVSTFSGQAGQVIKGAIQIQATGVVSLAGIPDVGIVLQPSRTQPSPSPNVSCAGVGGVALTNANGIATCDLVLGSQPGTYPVWAVVGGYEALTQQFTVTITPATLVATTIAINKASDNQSGAVGQALTTPLSAVVEDQFGNPIANTTVTWSVVQGSATLTKASTTSDANGNVSNGVTLGSTPGAIQIKVAAGSASAIFHVTATVAISGITKSSGDNQSAAQRTAFANPLVVNVTTTQGSAANIPVAFAVTPSGSATLSAATVNTDSSGNASVTVTAGSTPQAVQITASAGGKSVTFSLTVLKPGPVLTPASFLNGASFAAGPMVNGAVDPGFAPGSIITIKAVGLTMGLNIPAGSCLTGTPDDGLPGTGALPTNIGGVEFQFQSTLAPIFAICVNADGTEQANLQAPLEMGPPSAGVLVKYAAGTPSESDFSVGGVPVLAASPGIFEYFENPATKFAVAIKADGSVISATNPAHPGDTIQVYATGLGPVLPVMATNTPGVAGQKVYFTPTVSLGGTNVGGVTATYAENAIGIYLVEFQIPSGQTAGNISLVVGVISDKFTNNTAFTSQTSQIPIAQ